MGLLEATPVKDVLQAMDIPFVHLSLDFNKLVECPIGTTKVMKPGDDRAWCREHDHGKLPVLHDYCARVMACKLSWWLRKPLKVQPTVQEVNQQRNIWQKRCYELLDWILCEYCNDEKEDVFDKGLGLD